MTKAIFSIFSLLLINCTNKQVETPKTAHMDAELVSQVTSVQPGVPFWVALKFEMEAGWHVNWKNPGDAGLAPSIKWELPEGFRAGEINWPTPQRIPVGDLMLFGYAGTVLLPVEITPATTFDDDKFTLSAACDWVVCGDVCIPGEAILTLTLPVKKESLPTNAEHAAEIASARNKIPVSNDSWHTTALADENIIIIKVAQEGVDRIDADSAVFFPEVQGNINNAAEQQFAQDGFGFQLELNRDKMFPNVPDSLEGVIVLYYGEFSKMKSVYIDVPLSKKISIQN